MYGIFGSSFKSSRAFNLKALLVFLCVFMFIIKINLITDRRKGLVERENYENVGNVVSPENCELGKLDMNLDKITKTKGTIWDL